MSDRLAGLAIFTMFAGVPSQLKQWCNFHLNAGAEKLFVVLDRPDSTMVKSLPDDRRIHWKIIDQVSWDQLLSDSLILSRKQEISFLWAAETAKSQGFDYLAFVDGDELIYFKRPFRTIIAEIFKNVTALHLDVREMWRNDSDPLEEPFAASLAISQLSNKEINWKSLFGWKSQFMYNGFMGHRAGKSIYMLPLASGEISPHRPRKGEIADGLVPIADSDGCVLHFDSGNFDTWKFKWDSRSVKHTISPGMSPYRKLQFQYFEQVIEKSIEKQKAFFKDFFILTNDQVSELKGAGALEEINVLSLSKTPLSPLDSVRETITTNKQQAKRVVVVLSSGRSGTSLLMKALGAMGMQLSENLIPGRAENPDGFFEDAEIVELHKQLITDSGTLATLPLPDNFLESEVGRNAIPKFREILENRLANLNFIWGFKDPRTVTFLPVWNKVFNQAKIIPIFLLAIRNPAEVVVSHKRYYNVKKEVIELQWLQRTADALHHTAADCYIVHYEDWFLRPLELGEEILTYTGLDQYFSGSVDEALRDVIKPNLNRAVYDDYKIHNEYIKKFYEVLKDSRGADFDRRRLMDEVKECRRAMDGFKGWYMEAQKHIGQKAKIRERLEQEQGRNQDMKERIEKKRERIIKLESKVEAVQQKNNELSKFFEQELKETQNVSDKGIEQTKAEYEQALQKKDELINEMENDLHAITLQNNEFLKQLKDFQDEKENLNISMNSLQNELAEIKKAKTALGQAKEKKGQLKQSQADLEKLSKELERVLVLAQEKDKTLKEKHNQLKGLNDEKENLRIHLNSLQNELAEIKKAKTAMEELGEKQKQQALQQKEMTCHYRQSVKRLYTILRSLEKDYLAIKNSYTWRIGDFLVRCMELLLLRRKRPLVTDHLEQIFQEYKEKMPLFEPGQNELAQFKRWVKQIEKDFIDLFASRRWVIGNGFVFIMGGTRFSRKKYTARDHIERILGNFYETYKDKKIIDINGIESKQITMQIDSEDKKKTDAPKGRRRVSKPKLSVIIPVFNKKEYIESCINSLFQKEYENLEVICVNDASEDGSASILHACGRNDSRIRVFSHKANSGASAARNTGISLSDGKYLFFLDADDIVAENALAEMVEIAEKQCADVVRGKITGITLDGSQCQLAAEYLLHKKLQYKVKWAEEESLWFYWYFSANLYRASFIKKKLYYLSAKHEK